MNIGNVKLDDEDAELRFMFESMKQFLMDEFDLIADIATKQKMDTFANAIRGRRQIHEEQVDYKNLIALIRETMAEMREKNQKIDEQIKVEPQDDDFGSF